MDPILIISEVLIFIGLALAFIARSRKKRKLVGIVHDTLVKKVADELIDDDDVEMSTPEERLEWARNRYITSKPEEPEPPEEPERPKSRKVEKKASLKLETYENNSTYDSGLGLLGIIPGVIGLVVVLMVGSMAFDISQTAFEEANPQVYESNNSNSMLEYSSTFAGIDGIPTLAFGLIGFGMFVVMLNSFLRFRL